MERTLLSLAAAAGFLGVALGAFAAHALKGRLDSAALEAFRTGVLYQLVHALALIGAAFAATRAGGALARRAGFCFAAGIVLFSGSLYALALGAPRAVAMATPAGGVAFLAGWALLFAAARRG